jgi:hypothetical protein
MYLPLSLYSRHKWWHFYGDILIHKMNVFLFRLYMNMSCVTSQFNLLHSAVFVFLLICSQGMPLLKPVQYAQTNIALLTIIQGTLSFSPKEHTTAPLFDFGIPVLWMYDFQLPKLGYRWAWSALRHVTCCHVGFMGLYYQITHKNLPEFLCVMFYHRTSGSGKHLVWSCLSDGKTTSWSSSMFSRQFHSC